MMKLWRDKRGAIAVEFAILAPLFVFFLGISLEAARIQIASMLLERSVYDIAYQAKVARGKDFEMIVDSVLEERNNGIFKAEKVSVSATSAANLAELYSGGYSGAGGEGDIVHLVLTAELGLFDEIVPEPLTATRVIHYYYINEPNIKD